MHSSGSPLEGNDWLDRGDGRFTTRTDFNNWGFSDLDLYLMGLKPSSAVAPWFVIDNPDTMGFRDQNGQPLGRTSPPQILQTVTVNGTRQDVNIDQVTSALGTRRPGAGQAPNNWKVLFVMLAHPTSRLTESHKQEFATMVDGYAAGFREGSQNLGTLDYQLMAGPVLSPIGSPCAQANECDPAQATLCSVPGPGGPKFCTRQCANAGGCPGGWCCEPDGPSSAFICHPNNLCGQMMTPVDAGVPADTGTPTMTDPPAACACDLTTACDSNCACDPECVRRDTCTCDETFGCDPGCSCDPECAGEPRVAKDDCSCVEVPADRRPAGALLLLGALGLLIARRRRAS